jgi:uncharacterized protein
MKPTRRQFALQSLALLACGQMAVTTRHRIRVLIVDGINNHDWKTATRGIRAILLATGRFSVDVSTTPAADAPQSAWDAWNPDFARYHAVINNFNGGEKENGVLWPLRVRKAMERYVTHGGGLVVYHAANNAFLLWPAYNEMIGLGWRPASYGRGIAISDDDKVIFIPQGQGLGPNHPPRFDFQIHVRPLEASEPGFAITAGMPRVWMHPSEQLTHGQHGPAEGLTILTWAHSPLSHQNEPMDWVREYGKGRVYTTMLGHTWANEPSPNLDCVGFQTLLARGVEWAATGRVTIPIPSDFPGPDKVSLHPLNLYA